MERKEAGAGAARRSRAGSQLRELVLVALRLRLIQSVSFRAFHSERLIQSVSFRASHSERLIQSFSRTDHLVNKKM